MNGSKQKILVEILKTKSCEQDMQGLGSRKHGCGETSTDQGSDGGGPGTHFLDEVT